MAIVYKSTPLDARFWGRDGNTRQRGSVFQRTYFDLFRSHEEGHVAVHGDVLQIGTLARGYLIDGLASAEIESLQSPLGTVTGVLLFRQYNRHINSSSQTHSAHFRNLARELYLDADRQRAWRGCRILERLPGQPHSLGR